MATNLPLDPDLNEVAVRAKECLQGILDNEFAADFFLRKYPEVQEKYGEAIAAKFVSWWPDHGVYSIAETQREFDCDADEVCREWIEDELDRIQRVADTAKKDAEFLAEQERLRAEKALVKTIQDKWGITAKVANRTASFEETQIRLRNSRLSEDEVEKITRAIRQGTRKSIPASMRRKDKVWDKLFQKEFEHSTGKSEDAISDAWVKLLGEKTFDGRSANLAGRSAGRDAGRIDQQYLITSQSDLPAVAPEQGEQNLEEVILPWDDEIRKRRVSNGKETPEYETINVLLADEQDRHRRRILLQFKRERPEDFEFIIAYVARVGYEVRFRYGTIKAIANHDSSSPITSDERKRAFSIISRLRRLEKLTADK